MNLAYILKDSNYKLSQFTSEEIDSLEQAIILKQTKSGQVPYVSCLVRKKDIKLTPEEAIRQLYLRVLIGRYHYPVNRIQVEYGVNFGREVKRADIVVMDKDRLNTVYMIVELKKPKLKDGKDQLRSYCNATGAPIAVWTNGNQISWYQRKDPNYFEDIPGLPNANQTLADILQIKFTLEDLIANDKLRKEKKSLKALIEEMEDEVLANAGVDVFEELFKLIFTKLYDEWYSGQGNRRNKRSLEFRNTGQTEAALKNKIQDLFDQAKKKWEGVFSDDAKISLTPSHLSVCVSSLENVKLFNSNLDVIDEAFEYLINQSSKGEKGQFFTPRYVIDMCVKMLNPQEDEYMIDTAAGSSGFPVHTIFHVWKQILEDEGIEASHLFSLEDKPPRCREYVEEKVFAIDFDEKAVRVARTLNLIAGDGQTNVLHLNTLDYELWDEVTQQEDWQDIYFEGFKRLKKRRPNKDSYREFSFDVLMANPPFAGDIKEPRMIARYDLAKKSDGKWQSKVGRDILFIERNLDFLKPGGRMGIVLPQGRFNNSSDKYIRDYLAERCRILAVVGLHGNTFKPHTGTKTSVLFVQKWNDDPKVGALCPRKEDYNIFFATMRKSGKDNSGEKIWRRVYDSTDSEDDESVLNPPSPVERMVGMEGEFLQDFHGHLVVDHDLYNHEGLTEDGIAEAFVEFAKKEKLSFFKSSSSVTPFDAERYQQLMDGLEAIELNLSYVQENNISVRIDAEFFKKEYIVDAQKLSNKQTHFLAQIAKKIDVGIVEANKSHINPFYLVAFLNSKLGVNQLYRFASGGLQGHVNLTILENLQIPLLLKQFQSFLESVLIKAYKIFQYSKSLYQQAEDLLLSELNLKGWQPTEETVAVKSFSESYLISDRLDAEYYQPKHDELDSRIKSYPGGWAGISNLLVREIKNGTTPEGVIQEFVASKPNFIRAEAFNQSLGIDEERLYSLEEYTFQKYSSIEVCKEDILVSMTGTIGNVAIYSINNPAITNQNIVKLSCDKSIIDPYVLGFYIKTVGKNILFRQQTGNVQPYVNIPNFKKLIVPLLLKSSQHKILVCLNKSSDLKIKYKQLLEIAKTGVERAIETDEATATTWMNQQLEALGIERLQVN
jgi:type I restriction enzyme M protein